MAKSERRSRSKRKFRALKRLKYEPKELLKLNNILANFKKDEPEKMNDTEENTKDETGDYH
jgi:hypothetical protein